MKTSEFRKLIQEEARKALKEANADQMKTHEGTYRIVQDSNKDYYSIFFGDEKVNAYMIGGVDKGKFKYIGNSGCDCKDFFNAIVEDINKSNKFK